MVALKEGEVKKDRMGVAALCDSRERISINSALARELRAEGMRMKEVEGKKWRSEGIKKDNNIMLVPFSLKNKFRDCALERMELTRYEITSQSGFQPLS